MFSNIHTFLNLTGKGLGVFFAVFLSFAQAGEEDGTSLSVDFLKKGDQAYQTADYGTAFENYQKAISNDRFANRNFLNELYYRRAQAGTMYARDLVKAGDRKKALDIVDSILKLKKTADYAPAQQLQAQLLDPITTNPALSAEHSKDVEKVTSELRVAEGYYSLGDYDNALRAYNRVLTIDPYNKAARRGAEKTAVAQSSYAEAAYDSARANLLANVSKGWERPKDRSLDEFESLGKSDLLGISGSENVSSPVEFKLNNTTVEFVDLENAGIQEAVEYLRLASQQNDTLELDPSKRGVSFIINLEEGDPVYNMSMNLKLQNVSLMKVATAIAQQFGLFFDFNEYGATYSSSQTLSKLVVLKRYNVPPDFLSRGSNTKKAQGESNTPFFDSGFGISNKTGLTARKGSAQDILQGYGVEFGEFASAAYSGAQNQLIVRNTEEQHRLIQSIVDSINSVVPRVVELQFRLIQIQQNNQEELKTDVSIEGIVSDFISLGGGSVGNQLGTDLIPGNPVTAGNRSGGGVFDRDAIDDALLRPDAISGFRREEFDPVRRFLGDPLGVGDTFLDAGSGTGVTREEIESNPAPGIFGFQRNVDDATLRALLRGVNQKKGTDILVSPSIVSRSGETASAEIGQEFIHPTEYDPPEISQNLGDVFIEAETDGFEFDIDFDLISDQVISLRIGDESFRPIGPAITPAHPTAGSFETVLLGSKIEVEPTLAEGSDIVNLRLNSEFKEFEGFINYGSPILRPFTEILIDDDLKDEFFSIEDNDFLTDEFGNVGFVTIEGSVFDLLGPDFFEAAQPVGLINGIFDLGVDFVNGVSLFNRDRPNAASLEEFGDDFFGDGLTVIQGFAEASPNDILMPVFNSVNINTNVSIKSGTTMVLGGLLESKMEPVNDEVPLLGKIPLLGQAFKSRGERSGKKVVLLTVTAKVTDAGGNPQ